MAQPKVSSHCRSSDYSLIDSSGTSGIVALVDAVGANRHAILVSKNADAIEHYPKLCRLLGAQKLLQQLHTYHMLIPSTTSVRCSFPMTYRGRTLCVARLDIAGLLRFLLRFVLGLLLFWRLGCVLKDHDGQQDR